MDKNMLILLIEESSAGMDEIRRILADEGKDLKLRRVPDVPTALARIGGGGVDMILMSLPVIGSSRDNPLGPFLDLQAKAQGVPIVVLCSSADRKLAEAAMRAGAADSLIRETYEADLLRVLRSAAGKSAPSPDVLPRPLALAGKRGKIIVFMGAKGGAGTTTVAMNVAASLAPDRRVILAELHRELGVLHLYFQPHRSIRDLGDFFDGEGSEERGSRALETCLWPVKNVPGLQILYGSRKLAHSSKLSPANALRILALSAEISDYIIVDLPVSLSDMNRAVLESADCLSLVVEREPLAVQAAKSILREIDSWKAARLSIGAVILNRAAPVSPMSFGEIDAELGIPTFGVIPPAPDLCAAAQHAHAPLITLDRDSLISISMRDLGDAIVELVPSGRGGGRPDSGPLAAYHASQKLTRVGMR